MKKKDSILIYSILLLLPTYLVNFQFGAISLNLLDVIILINFSIFLFRFRNNIQLGNWKYLMGLFLILGATAALISPNLLSAIGIYKSYILEPVLVGIMILTLKPPFHKIIYALSSLALFIMIIGLFQYISGYGIPAPWNVRGDGFRITSIYPYPNAVGLIIAPILAMLTAWLIHIKNHRQIFIYLVLFGFAILLFARADGAIVALLAAMIVSMLYTRWRWIAIVSFLIVLALGFLWQPTREILLFQDTSGEVRLAIWEGTFNLLKDHPIVGAGLAGFPDAYQNYKLDRHVELLLYPHNIFLNFWVELGIAGLIWLLFALVTFLKNIITSKSNQKIILLAGMTAIIVYGLVDVPYFKNDLAIIFWTLLTMSSVIAEKK